jgi:predicted nucleic acid-binding protein
LNDGGALLGATSPVTLAECLVVPMRLAAEKVQEDFRELIVAGPGILFVPLDAVVAQRAADLRARYNLTLTDAFQLAAAIIGGCDAFLTNDEALERVQGIKVLVIGRFEA